ncbi:MAG: hypothetical protein ABR927_12770 [Bacteroidales bacterium]|jgi:hypothetical protein
MYNLKKIEDDLHRDLKIHSISEINELSEFKDFEEIKQCHERNEIVFGFSYQENVVDNFGSNGQKFQNRVLLLSPYVIIILSIIFSIIKSRYLLLFGIPLSLIGLILTAPSIMKQGSSLFGIIMISSIGLGIYYCFHDFVIGFLLLSFGIPNFFLTVDQQLNMYVFEEIVLKSEIVFIYYFIRGECYFKNRCTNKLYKKK